MATTNPFLYLQRNADENPRGVFIRSAGQTLTNADAVVQVKKIAYELRRLGVKAGDIVALDLPDQLSLLFTEAVYHEGGISTVIPTGAVVDPRVGVKWLFTNLGQTPPPGAQAVDVDRRFLRRIEENPYGISPSESSSDILRIVFSSGTTGTPRAVPIMRAMEVLMTASLPLWFQSAPNLILMDSSTVWGYGEFYLSVLAGQPFLSTGGASPDAIIALADAGKPQTIKGSPAQIASLVTALEASGRTITGVREVYVAGTVMPPGLADRTRAVIEGCTILTNYGSTEAGGGTTRLYESDDPFDAGHVSHGSTIEVVDENDQPVPVGTVGRIRHRSPGMAHEYLGDPEATAKAFRDGWFYPGDLGFFREDGGLTLAGRESEVLNAGGVKFDPNLLDLVAQQLPAVEEAAAFTFPDESGLLKIGMAVVATDDFDPKLLVDTLRARFGNAAPAMVARVESIPRARTGKPLRAELGERFAR